MKNRTTGIEWTDHTWNPFVGCTICTAGCTNCYAMRTAQRLQDNYNNPSYQGVIKTVNGNPVWTGRVNRSSDANVRKPYKLKHSIIFVNSMSDFFHENAKDEWRLETLEVMRANPTNVYQVLTKRPENIRPFIERTGETFPDCMWLGVTVEDSRVVDRIDILRTIPASIRFISFEPLIGPVGPVDLSGIHWGITGGESGPGCRPMEVEWVRDLHQQMKAQGVAHFFKQFGHYKNNPLPKDVDTHGKGGSMLDGEYVKEMPPGFSVTEKLL